MAKKQAQKQTLPPNDRLLLVRMDFEELTAGLDPIIDSLELANFLLESLKQSKTSGNGNAGRIAVLEKLIQHLKKSGKWYETRYETALAQLRSIKDDN